MVKITFSRSRSQQFNDAVRIFRMIPAAEEKDGIFSLELSAKDIFTNWENWSRLHHIVTKWSGCRVYMDSQLIIPYKMNLFYCLQDIYYCHREAKYHGCMIDLLRPGWGCRRLNIVKRHVEYSAYGYWYQFGYFSTDFRTWIVDKKKLLAKLEIDARDMFLAECPRYDPGRIREAVDQLPEKIFIDSKSWEIVYREDFVGDRIGKIPQGIRHIMPEDPMEELPYFPGQVEPEKTIDQMTNEEINRLIDEKLRQNG